MNISKESLQAHNMRKEDPCFNDNYNKYKKLGTLKERSLLQKLSMEKYGIFIQYGKLTKAYVEKYTEYKIA